MNRSSISRTVRPRRNSSRAQKYAAAHASVATCVGSILLKKSNICCLSSFCQATLLSDLQSRSKVISVGLNSLHEDKPAVIIYHSSFHKMSKRIICPIHLRVALRPSPILKCVSHPISRTEGTLHHSIPACLNRRYK